MNKLEKNIELFVETVEKSLSNYYQHLPKKKLNKNRLVVMLTDKCQINCSFCQTITNKREDMSQDTLIKSVNFLLSSPFKKVELHFFGGEPLLRFDLIKKAVLYAEKNKDNKTIRYTFATNGILLDKQVISFLKKYDFTIVFSTNRYFVEALKKNIKSKYSRSIKNLKELKKSGVDYIVNYVVIKEYVDKSFLDLIYLYSNNIDNIQIEYELGVFWDTKSIVQYSKQLIDVVNFIEYHKEKNNQLNFANYNNHDNEPLILGTDPIVNNKGEILLDASIFLEKIFPELKKIKLGKLSENQFDDIIKDRTFAKNLYSKLIKSETRKSVFKSNLLIGFVTQNIFQDLIKQRELRKIEIKKSSNERVLINKLIHSDFIAQSKIIKKIPSKIDWFILYINSPCMNNCIFCQRKFELFDNINKINKTLKQNKLFNKKSLAIIGDEPFSHPNIIEIIELAYKYGFRDIEVQTSGYKLDYESFVNKILKTKINLSLSLPIFALDKVHDNITQRQDSFKKLYTAINKIKKNPNIKLYLHTVLLRQNIKKIKKIEEFSIKNNIPFCITPLRPKHSNYSFNNLMPTYTQIIKEVNTNSLVGFPLCVIKKVQKDVKISNKNISKSLKIYLLLEKFYKPKKCKKCKLNNECVGGFKDYFKLYGTKELNPF